MRPILWFAVVLLSGCTSPGEISGPSADSAVAYGWAFGFVTDLAGEPVEGVEILSPAADVRTVSDSRGRFVLHGLPAGGNILVVEPVGVEPFHVGFLLLPNEPGRVDITVAAPAVPSALIDVPDIYACFSCNVAGAVAAVSDAVGEAAAARGAAEPPGSMGQPLGAAPLV